MLLRFLRWAVADRRLPDVLIGGPEQPYLARWHVLPRNNWLNVYVHLFLRSDDARALHDHPYANAALLLEGYYDEYTADGVTRRRPGTLYFRRAALAHRVQLLRDVTGREQPVWTLFLTGPRVREWGFHCPQGWRHWRDFTAGERGEVIGRGCD